MLFHLLFFLSMDVLFALFYHGLHNFGLMMFIGLALQYVYLLDISLAEKRYVQLHKYSDIFAALLLWVAIGGIFVLSFIGYLRGY